MEHRQQEKLQILVIENDKDISDSIKALLESENYQVSTFSDGKLALDRLKKNPESCLVLLDLIMPVMSGWSFMEEFLKLPVTIVPVPVYIFSVIDEKEGEAEKMGAKGYIKKPVNLEYLLGIVEDHCRCFKGPTLKEAGP